MSETAGPDGVAPRRPFAAVAGAATATTTATRDHRRRAAQPGATAGGNNRVLVVFIALMLAVLLYAMDQTIVATALPTIVGALHGASELQWVTTVYLLTATIGLPIYGKLGDIVGRKGLFIFAIGVFLLGSVLSGISQNMNELILFRGLQGVGGGGLMIGAQAIIGDIMSPRERGKYMGYFGAVFGVSTVAGPLIGGLLTQYASWRWIFYVNVVLGAIALPIIITQLKLPRHTRRPKLDIAGMALLAAASAAITLLATWGGSTYAWTSAVIIGLGAAFVVLAAAFVFAERFAAEPIIPLHLFRSSIFNITGLIGVVVGIALFGVVSYLGFFLQITDGLSVIMSGLMLLPFVGGMLVSSIASGNLVTKTGRYKLYPIVGTAIAGVGMYLLSLMSATTTLVENGIFMAVLGFGVGLVFQILVIVVQNDAAHRDIGAATAANNYFRQIGGTVGSGIVGSLFAARLASKLHQLLPASAAGHLPSGQSITPKQLHALPPAIAHSFVTAYAQSLPPIFLYMVPVVAAGFLLALFLKQNPLRTDVAVQLGGEGALPLEATAATPPADVFGGPLAADALAADPVEPAVVAAAAADPDDGDPLAAEEAAAWFAAADPDAAADALGTAEPDAAADLRAPVDPYPADAAQQSNQMHNGDRMQDGDQMQDRDQASDADQVHEPERVHALAAPVPHDVPELSSAGPSSSAGPLSSAVPLSSASTEPLLSANTEPSRLVFAAGTPAGQGGSRGDAPARGTSDGRFGPSAHVVAGHGLGDPAGAEPAGPQPGHPPAAHAGGARPPAGYPNGPVPGEPFPGSPLAGGSGSGGSPVHGRVQRADGTPLDGAMVTLIDLTGRQAGRDRTGPAGEYLISAPGAGPYTLIAMADAHQPHASAVRVAGRPVEVNLLLTGAARLAGTIRVAGSDAPLPEATVTVADVHGEVIAAHSSDADGRYLFDELVPGRYTLAISAPSFQPTALPVAVADGEVTVADAELSAGSRLEGTVSTSRGTAVADARVTLLDSEGNVVAVTTTGADGGYRFEDLPAGDYTMIATGYPPVASRLRIVPGQPHSHDVELGYPEA